MLASLLIPVLAQLFLEPAAARPAPVEDPAIEALPLPVAPAVLDELPLPSAPPALVGVTSFAGKGVDDVVVRQVQHAFCEAASASTTVVCPEAIAQFVEAQKSQARFDLECSQGGRCDPMAEMTHTVRGEVSLEKKQWVLTVALRDRAGRQTVLEKRSETQLAPALIGHAQAIARAMFGPARMPPPARRTLVVFPFRVQGGVDAKVGAAAGAAACDELAATFEVDCRKAVMNVDEALLVIPTLDGPGRVVGVTDARSDRALVGVVSRSKSKLVVALALGDRYGNAFGQRTKAIGTAAELESTVRRLARELVAPPEPVTETVAAEAKAAKKQQAAPKRSAKARATSN